MHAKTGTVITSIVVISPLQSIIWDQAAEFQGSFTACILNEKLDCSEEILQGTYNVVYSSRIEKRRWTKDLWISLKLPSLFNTNTEASFVDDDGIEVSLFVLFAL